MFTLQAAMSVQTIPQYPSLIANDCASYFGLLVWLVGYWLIHTIHVSLYYLGTGYGSNSMDYTRKIVITRFLGPRPRPNTPFSWSPHSFSMANLTPTMTPAASSKIQPLLHKGQRSQNMKQTWVVPGTLHGMFVQFSSSNILVPCLWLLNTTNCLLPNSFALL